MKKFLAEFNEQGFIEGHYVLVGMTLGYQVRKIQPKYKESPKAWYVRDFGFNIVIKVNDTLL